MSSSTLAHPKILLVDDTPDNLMALSALLEAVDAEVIEATSGASALAACVDHQFALILLDVQMPGMDGFDVASALSQDDATRDVPIIFLTAGYVDDDNRLKGYRSGAVDYIAKPINFAILLAKVRVFLDLFRNQAQLQQTMEELYTRNKQLRDEIVERRRLEEQARHQATHDALTGLPNRAQFMDRLGHSIERARREGSHFALAYIDIDGFKPVNDTHGHQCGDLLLQAIAGRLGEGVRKSDLAARLGGDEFAVILEEMRDGEAAVSAAEKLAEALRAPYRLRAEGIGPLTVQVGASMGLALFPQNGDGREVLLRAADQVMYRAKRGGENRVLLADSADDNADAAAWAG